MSPPPTHPPTPSARHFGKPMLERVRQQLAVDDVPREAGMVAPLAVRGTAVAEIVAFDADYITVQRLDDAGVIDGVDLLVAKPPKLRVTGQYRLVDSIVSTAHDQITVSHAGDADELWEVHPFYDIGNVLHIVHVGWTTVLAGDPEEMITWVDLNVDARAWTRVEEFTPAP